MQGKLSTQNSQIRHFSTLTCQLIMSDLTLVSGSDLENYLLQKPNYTKFSVESVSNDTIS